MWRQSVLVGLVGAVLVAGGCATDDPPVRAAGGAAAPTVTASTSPTGPTPASRSLCETIGVEALKKAFPGFEPEPSGQGSAEACVRVGSGSSGVPLGDLLKVLVTDPATETECAQLQQDQRAGVTWIAPHQLVGVGDFA